MNTKLLLFLLLAGGIIRNLLFAQYTQQGLKLVGTGAVGKSYQGTSVAISGDGNTVIEGGDVDNNFVGAVWIFTRSGSVWTQQGSKVVGSGFIGLSYEGSSVAISSDGNTAIVGGGGDNNRIGATWIFTRNGSIWTQQGSKLVGSGVVGIAAQGTSTAVSSDGNTAFVGGTNDNSSAGAMWVFIRDSSSGVWNQEGQKLIGTGAVGTAGQGYSTAISSDGRTAIEGGYFDNSDKGAAWVFVNPTTGITPISTEGPGDFNLSQNYPNPFNPTTTINYSISKKGNVKITVYNIIGSKLAVIVDENKTAGSYSVKFNAGNLPSGVYFYKLELGSYSDIKKLVLIK